MKKMVCTLSVDVFDDGHAKSKITGNGLDILSAYSVLTRHLIEETNMDFVKAAFEIAVKKSLKA